MSEVKISHSPSRLKKFVFYPITLATNVASYVVSTFTYLVLSVYSTYRVKSSAGLILRLANRSFMYMALVDVWAAISYGLLCSWSYVGAKLGLVSLVSALSSPIGLPLYLVGLFPQFVLFSCAFVFGAALPIISRNRIQKYVNAALGYFTKKGYRFFLLAVTITATWLFMLKIYNRRQARRIRKIADELYNLDERGHSESMFESLKLTPRGKNLYAVMVAVSALFWKTPSYKNFIKFSSAFFKSYTTVALAADVLSTDDDDDDEDSVYRFQIPFTNYEIEVDVQIIARLAMIAFVCAMVFRNRSSILKNFGFEAKSNYVKNKLARLAARIRDRMQHYGQTGRYIVSGDGGHTELKGYQNFDANQWLLFAADMQQKDLYWEDEDGNRELLWDEDDTDRFLDTGDEDLDHLGVPSEFGLASGYGSIGGSRRKRHTFESKSGLEQSPFFQDELDDLSTKGMSPYKRLRRLVGKYPAAFAVGLMLPTMYILVHWKSFVNYFSKGFDALEHGLKAATLAVIGFSDRMLGISVNRTDNHLSLSEVIKGDRPNPKTAFRTYELKVPDNVLQIVADVVHPGNDASKTDDVLDAVASEVAKTAAGKSTATESKPTVPLDSEAKQASSKLKAELARAKSGQKAPTRPPVVSVPPVAAGQSSSNRALAFSGYSGKKPLTVHGETLSFETKKGIALDDYLANVGYAECKSNQQAFCGFFSSGYFWVNRHSLRDLEKYDGVTVFIDGQRFKAHVNTNPFHNNGSLVNRCNDDGELIPESAVDLMPLQLEFAGTGKSQVPQTFGKGKLTFSKKKQMSKQGDQLAIIGYFDVDGDLTHHMVFAQVEKVTGVDDAGCKLFYRFMCDATEPGWSGSIIINLRTKAVVGMHSSRTSANYGQGVYTVSTQPPSKIKPPKN